MHDTYLLNKLVRGELGVVGQNYCVAETKSEIGGLDPMRNCLFGRVIQLGLLLVMVIAIRWNSPSELWCLYSYEGARIGISLSVATVVGLHPS